MLPLPAPELAMLAGAALVAGIVRGFSGFGTAMIFLPVAARLLGPFEALSMFLVMDIVAPLMHVPRALRESNPPDVLRLGLGAAIGIPIGLWVLSIVDPIVFRWSVSLVALALLVCLISGIRYRGRMTPPLVVGTGFLGGITGGSAGLPGPPIILLYVASTLPPSAIRATITLYLIVADVLMLAVIGLRGLLVTSVVLLGALAILPYLLGNWLGALMFRPEAEALYRRIAYAIIAASAILGLPIWG